MKIFARYAKGKALNTVKRLYLNKLFSLNGQATVVAYLDVNNSGGNSIGMLGGFKNGRSENILIITYEKLMR